uniref:Receptor-like serine/threonine-protein kinase n=1 Tax=Davidia involucrata TaxID=16924 RepID=A0A5B7ABP7_DAVIN
MASAMIPSLLFLSLLPFLPILAVDNVTLSSSLTGGDNSSWISPSEEFAFGFRQLNNNTNLFLLAIWYAKIPDKTIVWQANTTNPVQRGSKVLLMENGIILNDPNGQTIWKSEVEPNTSTVSYGAMLNTGNFVLSSGTTYHSVWESFNNPTDTILPTQRLGLGFGGMLFYRLTENNYSKGRFELRFSNGTLRLYPVAWPTKNPYASYYKMETFNATDSSESGYQLVFNESAYINIVKRNGENIVRPISWSWQPFAPNSNNYYRATLDFDGVFRQYAYPRMRSLIDGDDQSWSVVRYLPDNICNAFPDQYGGSGACGFNSYCRAKGGTPSCECPPGYTLMDPNNKFGGCKLEFPQGCGVLDDELKDPMESYDLANISGLNWPYGNYEVLAPYNLTQCEQSCLHDCLCDVAIFNGTSCWKKKLPLANGRLQAGVALIKIRKSVPPLGSNTKTQKLIFVGPLVSSLVFNFLLLLVMISGIVLVRRRNRKSAMRDSSVGETNLRVFSFKELKDTTDGFKDELGRGSFGIVYKGALKFGSRNLVAVKKLDKLSQEGEKEFRAEVRAIGKTHHKNLVDLFGYCHEGPHRLLVYEFMSNGSLADFLSRSPRPDWNQRAQVAMGIARGLVYLHEECNAPIIHCDIKLGNILLDNHFTARISDFGLAKSLMFDQTRTLTGIRGTRGYVAPEWFKNVPVTVKVDVYSFGVMLLEIICCRKSLEMVYGEDERAILTNWVYDCYMEGKLEALVLENDDVGLWECVISRL